MILLDTNVIINYLLQEEKSINFIEEIFYKQEQTYISTITEIEILSYSKLTNEEIEKISAFLNYFNKIPVYSQIAIKAAEIRRKYKTPALDALIAASALKLNIPLATFNIKDFKKIKELKLIAL